VIERLDMTSNQHKGPRWQDHRNQQVGTVNCQFRTAAARIKLKRLYPVQQLDEL